MRVYALGAAGAACFGLAQGFLVESVRAGLSGFFLVCGAMLIGVTVAKALKS